MAKTEKRRTATGKKPAGSAQKRLTGDIAKAVRAALDKKADDVVVLDLRHTPAFTDFFLLCSGQNPRQVHAIADAVEETLKAARIPHARSAQMQYPGAGRVRAASAGRPLPHQGQCVSFVEHNQS